MTSKHIPARLRFSDDMDRMLSKLAYTFDHDAHRIATHLLYPRDGYWTQDSEGNRLDYVRGEYITHATIGNYLSIVPMYDADGLCVDAHLSYIRANASRETGKVITVTGKIGKTLKKFILPEHVGMFSDSEYEALVNALKLVVMRDHAGTFDIVRGEDIRAAYDEDNYADDDETGSLGESCMRYSYCYDYLQIYADNPRQVSLLTYRNNDGELLGRALLWNDGTDTYMDRAYGSDVVREMFYAYASEHNFTVVYDSGVSLTIHLDNARFSAYPYMDSLCYLSLSGDSGYLSTSSYHASYALRSTEGEPNLRGAQCADCGDWMEYRYYDQNQYCDDCLDNHRCELCGDTVRESSAENYVLCPSCVRDAACKHCGEVDPDRDGSYCETCLENMQVCERCDALHDDETVTGHCADCFDNHRVCLECGDTLVKPLPSASVDAWEAWYADGSGMCSDCKTFHAHQEYIRNQNRAGQMPLFSEAFIQAQPWGIFYGRQSAIARLSASTWSYDNRRKQDRTMRYVHIAANTERIARFNAITD